MTGGPEVAAAMLGWHNAFHCEINPFGRKVLEYWFPESVSYEDITKTNFKEWRGKIDILTGGFPCQPFSYAGKRGGQKDERYLWPEMCRAIQEIRPTWVVGENVAGITTMVEGGVLSEVGDATSLFQEGDIVHGYELEQSFTIERICRDLERIGYSVQPMLIPAAAVGAPHRRDRIFILAYDADSNGSNDLRIARKDEGKSKEERLSERHEVRIVGESVDVRQEACDASSHAYGRRSREIQTSIHSRLSDGNEPISDGREWDATDTHGAGLQESQHAGREADSPEAGGRIHHRAVRPRLYGPASHTFRKRLETYIQSRGDGKEGWEIAERYALYYSDDAWLKGMWWDNFPTIPAVHRGNDGIPFRLDDLTISQSKWRTESIKAYGNAIVPQVMYRIFQAIGQQLCYSN